jgi:hypothetical protein
MPTATTASKAPKFRYIGITDECVVCQNCGKPELKSTIVLAVLDEDGNEEEITYYGSTCAARALAIRGGGRAVRQSAIWARQNTLETAKDARSRLARYGLPESGEPTPEAFKTAVRLYARNNFNEFFPHTPEEWREMTREHMQVWQKAVAEAALLGA